MCILSILQSTLVDSLKRHQCSIMLTTLDGGGSDFLSYFFFFCCCCWDDGEPENGNSWQSKLVSLNSSGAKPTC